MIRILLCLLMLAGPALAVEPDEVLSDAALEARARDLSADLRCPVCQNENIDESNAQLAKDLRVVLRERLTAGDSDKEAVDYLVRRYGEFILLNPPKSGANWLLWFAGPVMLGLALLIGWLTIKGRAKAQAKPLDKSEQDRLDEILRS